MTTINLNQEYERFTYSQVDNKIPISRYTSSTEILSTLRGTNNISRITIEGLINCNNPDTRYTIFSKLFETIDYHLRTKYASTSNVVIFNIDFIYNEKDIINYNKTTVECLIIVQYFECPKISDEIKWQ